MLRFLLLFFIVSITSLAASAQTPAGRWSGEWISETSGHSGPLNARIRQIDDCTYRATFHGRFAGVIPFWYTTKFHMEASSGDTVVMGAAQRLPLLGEYRTTATVTSSNFDATFTSRRDSGRFVMSRR